MSATAPGFTSFQAELRRYLHNKSVLFSPQINGVVADLVEFASAGLRDGFRTALNRLTTDAKVWPTRTFIEFCEAIVEHHTRDVRPAEQELIGKSLFEAYIHFAGPQHAFEHVSRTRFTRSLRRRGAKGFAATFLSLHLFNMVCREISEDAASRMPDQQSYELYMHGIERVCRDVVVRAMRLLQDELDERWVAAIVGAIEAELFHVD